MQTKVVAVGLITATLGAALIVAATASGVTPGSGQKATVTVAGQNETHTNFAQSTNYIVGNI